jgi:hypothetical protein
MMITCHAASTLRKPACLPKRHEPEFRNDVGGVYEEGCDIGYRSATPGVNPAALV